MQKLLTFCLVFGISFFALAKPDLESSITPDEALLIGNEKYQDFLSGGGSSLIEVEKFYSLAWSKFMLDANLQRNLYLVRYTLAAKSWDRWSSKLSETYSFLDEPVRKQVNSPELLKLLIDLSNSNAGEDEELEERLRNILRKSPSSGMAWSLLSEYHEYKKNYEAAIEAAKYFKRLNPDSAEADYEIGNLYYKQWAAQECSIGTDYLALNSMKYILEASKKSNDNSLLQNRLTFSYKYMGLFPLAIEIGKAALANEENEYTLRDLAEAYLLDGQYEESERLYKKLAKKYDKEYYYHLAILSMRDANFKAYKKYYKKVSRDRYIPYAESIIHNRLLTHFFPKKGQEDLEIFRFVAPYAKERESRWNKITFNYIINNWSDEKYLEAARNSCDMSRAKFYKGLKLWQSGFPDLASCEIRKSMSYGVYITNEYFWAKVLLDSGLLHDSPSDCGATEIVNRAAEENVYPSTVEEFIWALENTDLANISVSEKAINVSGPSYPHIAKFDRVEGYAIVELSINEAGVVESVELIEEDPPFNYFGQEAIKAAWKRRYYPKVEETLPVAKSGIKVKYTFRLPNDNSEDIRKKRKADAKREYTAPGNINPIKKVILHEPERKDGDYQIVKLHPPHYEDYLRKARIEGWVIVEYSLNEFGEVEGAKVFDEQPQGVFSYEAIKSIQNTIYEPAFENGNPVRTDNIRTKVKFQIASDVPLEQISCSNSKSEFGNTSCTEID